MNTLHIYAQDGPHDDAYIVGDHNSLVKLRDAINNLLGANNFCPTKNVKAEMMASDGEGYDLHIILSEDENDKLSLPYTNELFEDQGEGAIWPWSLIKGKQAK